MLLKNLLYRFFLFLIFIPSIANSATEEQYEALLINSGLDFALSLSPTYIDNEISQLKLSNTEREALRQKLYIRFNSTEVSSELLDNLKKQAESNHTHSWVSLLSLYNSQEATLFHEQIMSTFNKKNHKDLVEYYSKVQTVPPQKHRYSIARAYDGLNHLSAWHAILLAVIQQSILSELDEKQSKHYITKAFDEHLLEFSSNQEVLTLFAFRNEPSDVFIDHFNSLALASHQNLLSSIELTLKSVLDSRLRLNIKLNSDN